MRSPRWLAVALVAAAAYALVGTSSTVLAATAGAHGMVLFWRWSAFFSSGVVFLVHIAYERLRLGSGVAGTAWHTSLAVALGALGLAAVANVREAVSAVAYRPRMLVALVGWPLVTAVPAFVVALVVASMVRRKSVAP